MTAPSFANGASYAAIRAMLNTGLADIENLKAAVAALQAGGTPTPTPSPTVTLSAAQSKAEGNSGTTAFIYTVTRSNSAGSISVPWSFAAGTTSASDYAGGTLPSGGTVAIADGATTGTITINVAGDTTVEPDEQFTVLISAPSGYVAGTSMSATGTILNDDTAAAPIVLLSPAYTDDMSGSGLVSARPNWNVTTNPNSFAVSDGAAHNTAQYSVAGGEFGSSQGDTFRARFGYDLRDGNGDAYTDTSVLYRIWENGSSYLTITLNKASNRVSITPTSGGNNGSSVDWTVPKGFKTNGEFLVLMRAGKLRLMVDGRWLPAAGGIYSYPFDQYDYSSFGGTKGGFLACYQQTWRFPALDYISVESVGFAVDSIDEFVGRDSLTATGGKALLAGTMASGAAPSRWVYRLLTPGALGTVIQDWADMTSVTVTGSTMTGYAFLPTGGPYIVQAGYVDSSDGKTRAAYSTAATSGIRGEVYGQSNAVYRNNQGDANASTKTDAAATSPADGSNAPAGAWATSNNALAPTTMNTAAKVIAAAIGKPVGIGIQGVPGVPIDNLVPGSGGWDILTTNMAARRGVVEFVLWDQGEGDADGAYAPTTYADKFRNQLLPGLRTLMNNPTLPVFISPVGRLAANTSDVARLDSQREVLRQQYLAVIAAEPTVRFADSKVGALHRADPNDAYHYDAGSQGYSEMARREGYTIAKALGASIADGRGPLPSAATRSGAVIDITVDLNGGNGLTGPATLSTGPAGPSPTLQGMNGFQVSADNFATTLAINSIALAGNAIRITLAADPGKAVKVRSHYGLSYDDSVLFYTTYADGRAAIPVFPIMTPIAAA